MKLADLRTIIFRLLIPVFIAPAGLKSQCITVDSLIYDMNPALFTIIPPNGSSSQLRSDFTTIKTSWIIEGRPSNYRFFNSSTTIYPPAEERLNIFFSGDQPSASEGAGTVNMVTRDTYNLLEGPITISATFYNRSSDALYNENWHSIVPANYRYYCSPVTSPVNNREGIRVGGHSWRSGIWDSQSDLLPDKTIINLTPHYQANDGQWFETRITWDTGNGQFRVRAFEINSGAGWKRVWANPVNLGPVSNFPWLKSVRLSVLGDDMVDSIRILRKKCNFPCRISSKPDTLCQRTGVAFADSLFLLNDKSPKNSSFTIISFNGSRSHPYVAAHPIISGNQIRTDRPAGRWGVRIITPCGRQDTTYLVIRNEASNSIYTKPIPVLCSSRTPFDLLTVIDSVKILNGVWRWTGSGVSGRYILPAKSGDSIFSKSQTIRGIYTTPQGCRDTITLTYLVRNAPSVKPQNKQFKICEGSSLKLNGSGIRTNGITWKTAGGADGTFSRLTGDSVTYYHGKQDLSNGKLTVKLMTLPIQSDPCPAAVDSVLIYIVSKPLINPEQPVVVCEGNDISFGASEISGKQPGALRWEWIILPENTFYSTDRFSMFRPEAGFRDLRLTVTDTNASCSVNLLLKDQITVNPLPAARFNPIPKDFTSSNYPYFRFENLSTTRQDKIVNRITAWKWKIENQTWADSSALESPVFQVLADTARYMVTLTAITDKGCQDTAMKPVFVIGSMKIHLPTAFTPDEEGLQINNTYRFHGIHFRSAELKIYNRWGQLLFRSKNGEGWDGRYGGHICPEGVYAAIVTVKDFEGYSYQYKQAFHLIR